MAAILRPTYTWEQEVRGRPVLSTGPRWLVSAAAGCRSTQALLAEAEDGDPTKSGFETNLNHATCRRRSLCGVVADRVAVLRLGHGGGLSRADRMRVRPATASTTRSTALLGPST